MTDQTEREPPDPENLEEMRDNAVNSAGNPYGNAQKEVRAQILQTQQLNYDVDRLNQNITDLNENLQEYSKWSRWLTGVLIALGLLQLVVATGVI